MGKDPKLRLRFCCCVQHSLLCVHKSMRWRIAAFLTFCPKDLQEPLSDGHLHCLPEIWGEKRFQHQKTNSWKVEGTAYMTPEGSAFWRLCADRFFFWFNPVLLCIFVFSNLLPPLICSTCQRNNLNKLLWLAGSPSPFTLPLSLS